MNQMQLLCSLSGHQGSPVVKICTKKDCLIHIKTVCVECLCNADLNHSHGEQISTNLLSISDYRNKIIQILNEQIKKSLLNITYLEDLSKQLQKFLQEERINQQENQSQLDRFTNQFLSYTELIQGLAIYNKTNYLNSQKLADRINEIQKIIFPQNVQELTLEQTQRLSTIQKKIQYNQSTLYKASTNITAVAISKDSKYIAVGDSSTVKIFTQQENVNNIGVGNQIVSLSYSNILEKLAVGLLVGQIKIYSYQENQYKLDKSFNQQNSAIVRLSFIQKEQLCSMSEDGLLQILKLDGSCIQLQKQKIEQNNKKNNQYSLECLPQIVFASMGEFLLIWFTQSNITEKHHIENDQISQIQANLMYLIVSGQKRLYFYGQLYNQQKSLQLKMILPFDNNILNFSFESNQLFVDLASNIQILELNNNIYPKITQLVVQSQNQAFNLYNTRQSNNRQMLLVTRGNALLLMTI